MNTKTFLMPINKQTKAKAEAKGTRGRQGKGRRRWNLRDTVKRRKNGLAKEKSKEDIKEWKRNRTAK